MKLRVADLVGSRVEDASGRRIGRVVELELGPDWEVTALLVGAAGWLDRWNLPRVLPRPKSGKGERVPWRRVARFEALRVRLKDEA